MFGFILYLLGLVGCNPVAIVADIIGTTEPALKLLVTILWSYPLAVIYHKYVEDKLNHSKKYNDYRHMFFIITGLDAAFYNFGISLYHNIIPVIVIYATTWILGPGKNNAIVTLIFNMTYLITGYIMTESDDYDITWTMPHCVLTLKLIALAFDTWDGQKKKDGEELSANNKLTALEKPPTFEELLGFVYFPACFMVGPVFSFRRYKDYVSDKFPLQTEKAQYESYAMKRLIQGVLYLIAFQVGVSVFNMKYMLSDEFADTSIIYRHFYCGLWAHFALYKYIACWLLTEAACVRFGLSYNGMQQENGTAISKWDGCNNIKLLRFESATKFQHYIDSFNCNTNYFAAEYVYKRLKFLGNRNLSQIVTLMFLAIWHGTQSGYYLTFLNEFLIIIMEKDIENILSRTSFYEKMWSNNYIKYYVLYVLLKMYTIVFMGWSLVPFDLKRFSKWWTVYSSLYFSGFLIFIPWSFVYKPLLIKLLKYTGAMRPKTQ